jgi:PKD repeat protein
MNVKWTKVTRGISVIIVGCAGVVTADAQIVRIPPRPTLAYRVFTLGWWCPPCPGGGGCPAGCYDDHPLSVVVTPFGETVGPWDAQPTWSPDATRIAYVRSDDIYVSGDILLADAAGNPYWYMGTTSNEWSPAWSPDGRRLAFASDRDGPSGIYIMNSDGSNVVRVGAQISDSPTWSPDSTRIAFACVVESANRDICVINSDGTGFRRLTDHPGWDGEPAWSPDGRQIAFVTTRYELQLPPRLAVMNPDGSGVSPLGEGEGYDPAWSSDGRRIAFTRLDDANANALMYVMRADGSDVTFVGYGDSPSWMPGSLFARFATECSGWVCSFDASSSVGDVTGYAWDFGDGATASGRIVSHTFAEGGIHTTSLVVTDANGATATEEVIFRLNRPPIASFTASCNALECIFDARASSDSDGQIVVDTWDFGDGSGGNDIGMSTHTYRAPGTYTVVLTVTDNFGWTDTYSVTLRAVHVGDLDGVSTTSRNSWIASVTIMVHDDAHRPVANATVTGSWSSSPGARGSCTTDGTGVCTIMMSDLSNSIGSTTFNVLGVVAGPGFYDAARNHDVDAGTNGTIVTIRRR